MKESVTDLIEYEQENGVGIWRISDMKKAIENGDMEDAEDHYVSTVNENSMKGTVVVIGNAGAVGREALDHVNDKWTEIGDRIHIERTAYVAEGITAKAIISENEATSGEFKAFEDEEEALDWASKA